VSETNRIVGIATEKLGMHFPLDNETTVVQP
jgi:cell division protein FtsL